MFGISVAMLITNAITRSPCKKYEFKFAILTGVVNLFQYLII